MTDHPTKRPPHVRHTIQIGDLLFPVRQQNWDMYKMSLRVRDAYRGEYVRAAVSVRTSGDEYHVEEALTELHALVERRIFEIEAGRNKGGRAQYDRKFPHMDDTSEPTDDPAE